MAHQWTIANFIKESEKSEKAEVSTYQAAVMKKGIPVRIVLRLENCGQHDHAEFISGKISAQINWVMENADSCFGHVAAELTAAANKRLNKGEPKVTEEDFRNRLALQSIHILATGKPDPEAPINEEEFLLNICMEPDMFGGNNIQLRIHEDYKLGKPSVESEAWEHKRAPRENFLKRFARLIVGIFRRK